MSRNERLARLGVDIDTRLAAVWTIVWDGHLGVVLDGDELARNQFGACLRAAYALGYQAALREESEGRRGELARANGYTKEGA